MPHPHEIIHAKYPAPDLGTQDEQVSISKHELALKLHKAALDGMEAAMNKVVDDLDILAIIQRRCLSYLSEHDIQGLNKYLANIAKIILVITKEHKTHPEFTQHRFYLLKFYNSIYDSLLPPSTK